MAPLGEEVEKRLSDLVSSPAHSCLILSQSGRIAHPPHPAPSAPLPDPLRALPTYLPHANPRPSSAPLSPTRRPTHPRIRRSLSSALDPFKRSGRMSRPPRATGPPPAQKEIFHPQSSVTGLDRQKVFKPHIIRRQNRMKYFTQWHSYFHDPLFGNHANGTEGRHDPAIASRFPHRHSPSSPARATRRL